MTLIRNKLAPLTSFDEHNLLACYCCCYSYYHDRRQHSVLSQQQGFYKRRSSFEVTPLLVLHVSVMKARSLTRSLTQLLLSYKGHETNQPAERRAVQSETVEGAARAWQDCRQWEKGRKFSLGNASDVDSDESDPIILYFQLRQRRPEVGCLTLFWNCKCCACDARASSKSPIARNRFRRLPSRRGEIFHLVLQGLLRQWSSLSRSSYGFLTVHSSEV